LGGLIVIRNTKSAAEIFAAYYAERYSLSKNRVDAVALSPSALRLFNNDIPFHLVDLGHLHFPNAGGG
jgi:hypothetical protein